MSNPAMPNLPGFGAITETMELVRKMWGGMGASGTGTPGLGIPGMVMPSLSVEDIDKQVADLKAVESWLTLNMNMLRGTIQALEVQSATISTLKTMSENFSAAVKPPLDAGGKAGSGFTFPFGGASVTQPAAASEVQAAQPAPNAPSDNPAPAAASKDIAADNAALASQPAFTVPIVNPAAWWNMLQDQFKHAVSTAMTPESGAEVGVSLAAKSGAKPVGKRGAAKKASAPKKKSATKAVLKRAPKTAPRQR